VRNEFILGFKVFAAVKAGSAAAFGGMPQNLLNRIGVAQGSDTRSDATKCKCRLPKKSK
jgi:hypothetical protein